MPPTAALAGLNFFLADVQSGLGPFLATWLAAIGWQPERVGLVMTLGGLVGLLGNAPAGMLVDRTQRPRLWVATAALTVLIGTLAMLPARGFATVAIAQVAASLGAALMAPALIALTLAIVGKQRFPHQQGRNQAWNHAGNVAAAGAIAAATFVLGAAAAFWVLAGMALGSALALAAIPAGAVDTTRGSGHAAGEPPTSLRQLLADRRLLLLGLALLLFHLGNASMLPLLGQRMAALGQGDATRWLAACVVVAQLAMVPVAIIAARVADRLSRDDRRHNCRRSESRDQNNRSRDDRRQNCRRSESRDQTTDRAWLLVVPCLVLPLRGVLAAFGADPLWLIPIQILDACGAGTLDVAVPVLVADLTWGTGRTQSALGVISTMQGIGAALSASFGGVLATWFGWEAAFLGLSLPAVLALILALRLRAQASSANAAAISLRV